MSQAKNSEVHAYIWTKERLQELGWNTSNPERNASGETYTQHECLQNPLIKKYLIKDVPENVIIIRPNKFLVIEAKSDRKFLNKAEKEVKEYAAKLNKDKVLCPIVSAIAGGDHEEMYTVSNFYFKKGIWREIVINGKVVRGLLSKEIAQRLVDEDSSEIDDIQISDDILFKKATKINEIFHNGSINKNTRARLISAILLAMSDDAPINSANSTSVLVKEINAKVESVLSKHNKREFAKRIEIIEPLTPDNHVKFRKAIIDSMQELEDMNIRSAMNSGTDILGRFYEVFLKYGNGAKEIGIVLTPRHITSFAAKALRISKNDKVFDPACGTGGFLVAAYDWVRQESNQKELNKFKLSGLYGVEQEAEVVALALVNMIFRGDGKSNIVEGNCFSEKYFKAEKMSKVLMNPPFALKKDDEKEYKFINFALRKIETGGLLFAIIPSPIMFRGKNFKQWREDLLKNHTLKAVIKLPDDLFYPVGVHTSIIIIEAHKPHKNENLVLWGILEDQLTKKKGVRKESKSKEGNMDNLLSKIHSTLDNHIFCGLPKQWILKKIEMDSHLECAPEEYLEDEKLDKKYILSEMRKVLMGAINSKMTKDIL